MKDILLVEDNLIEGSCLFAAVQETGYTCDWVKTLAGALHKLGSGRYRLALVDYELPDGTGSELLLHTSGLKSAPAFYMMSSFGTISRAVETLKLGARDFLEKPIRISAIRELLNQNAPAPVETRARAPGTCSFPEMVYSRTSAFAETVETALLVADKNCSVYLHGESGTGKEVLARLIHAHGARSGGPMVTVNCSAIPDSLFESELFGYKKGAFTGADRDQPGRIRQAHGGILFLDEIGDVPLSAQAKLLRVLQEKSVTPLGSSGTVPVDFRLICATHKDLAQAVENGSFREDLYYRVNVVRIDIPPLRERPSDIPLLVYTFLETSLPPAEARAETEALPPEFLSHAWPGNIRQLKNAVEKYIVFRTAGKSWGEMIGARPASGPPPELVSEPAPPSRLPTSRSKHTDATVLAALENNGFHRGRTAAALGMTRRALQYRLLKLQPEK